MSRMNSVEQRLYGSYPAPNITTEYKNGYGVAPKQGDNVALVMQGWANVNPTNNVPQTRGPIPSAPLYTPQAVAYSAQLAAAPSAGSPTNPGYNVYSPMSAPAAGQYSPLTTQAAGQYKQVHGEALPRSGRGVFADSALHDHLKVGDSGMMAVGADGRQQGIAVPRGDGMAAWQRGHDSLQAFMTGLGGGGHDHKDGQADFIGTYGNAHAGKATVSHIAQVVNGLQGPTEPLDAMPHMRHFQRGQHMGQLEASPEGGYVPNAQAAAGRRSGAGNSTFSGLRIFAGMPQQQDHVQISPTGLTINQDPRPPRSFPTAAAAQSHMAMGPAGLSHMGNDFGYPAMRNGPFVGRTNAGNLIQNDKGIVQGGFAEVRQNQYAGKSSKSQLTAGAFGLGGDGSGQRNPAVNPHAGKGQASQITYSSGTLTVLPTANVQGGNNQRGPSTGANWATTYDDTYTKVQASHGVVAQHMQDAFPHRF